MYKITPTDHISHAEPYPSAFARAAVIEAFSAIAALARRSRFWDSVSEDMDSDSWAKFAALHNRVGLRRTTSGAIE